MSKRKRPREFVVISDDDDEKDAIPHPSPKHPPPQDWSPIFNASRQTYSSSVKQPEECRQTKSEDHVSTVSILGPSKGTQSFGKLKYDIATENRGKFQYQQSNMQLWVDKYSPKNLSDLAVHSKKVAEVRAWLEAQLHDANRLCVRSSVLVLTGPTGVGKTTVVHVLADMLNAELCEWDAPVPTLWKEHLHHANSGAPYTSKLKEFEAFLESVRKYPLLPVTPLMPQEIDRPFAQQNTLCGRSKVLLLDDLPTVHGRESMLQLCHCLHNFAVSVQFPTIVVITEFLETGENGQETSRVTAELQQSLESGGAMKIAFNPITANAISKVLTRIAKAEKCPVSLESISLIAESCGGDIRHAIYSLQFLCLGQRSTQSTWDPGGVRVGSRKVKRGKVSVGASGSKISLPTPFSIGGLLDQREQKISITFRDGVLSLFHALGKLLYNKRRTDEAMDSGESIKLILKEQLQRHPLNMEEPEIILSQAHTEAGVFSSFLHENLLEFIDDEAVEDVAASMSYLSDADYLLGVRCRLSRTSARSALLNSHEVDPGHIAEATAGSLAARGVLFANTHPAPRRWQSMRAPALRQVERSLSEKKAELWAKSWAAGTESLFMVSKAAQATEYEPYLKQMVSPSGHSAHVRTSVPDIWCEDLSKLDFKECETASEKAMTLSQEHQLSTDLRRAMEIDRRIDLTIENAGSPGCEDEIEEW